MKKHIIPVMCLLLILCPQGTVHAGWFSKDKPQPDPVIPLYEQKIQSLETTVADQNQSLSRWRIATSALSTGCVIFLIIGAALGSTTRKHYDATTARRVGQPTP